MSGKAIPIGLALAYKPPATILQIATQTFTGLAVLFPTVIFGLYFKRVFPLAAILSILCGEVTRSYRRNTIAPEVNPAPKASVRTVCPF